MWEAFSLERRMSWIETNWKTVLDTLTAVSTLVALGALVITVFKNRSDEETRKQQELLEQCKRTLEWAYNALMPDPKSEVAMADRLNWLTAARHIIAYQELKKLVTKDPQSRIVEDFEEFWRHRFHLALSSPTLSTYHYWAAPEPLLINIHPTSALVVVDFAGWPDERPDPVDLPDRKIDLLKSRKGLKGNAGFGLKGYLQQIELRHGKGTPSPRKPD